MTGGTCTCLTVGTQLPTLTVPAISRTTLALYAGASGDHLPLHIDQDYARGAGMPDVIGHGMLTAAWLARLLTLWVPQERIRSLSVRFVGIAHLHNAIHCTGLVAAEFVQDGERRVRLQIQAVNQFTDRKVVGEAVVALPQVRSTGARQTSGGFE